MKRYSRRKFVKKIFLSIISLFILDIVWFEKYFIDWNFFDISKSNDQKIKILQISDLHLDSLQLKSFHKTIAEKINASQPDLICITGDSVSKKAMEPVLHHFLQLIDQHIPKIAIMGNWEYMGNANIEKLKDVYLDNNCELLINENRCLTLQNRNINIIGVDDYISGKPDLVTATKHLKQTNTNIILAHCPQYRDVIMETNLNFSIDLILSGHTHGGQITFLGMAPITPRGSGHYVKGWYTDQKPIMYISKGIGTSIIPIRFGARAEIVTFYV